MRILRMEIVRRILRIATVRRILGIETLRGLVQMLKIVTVTLLWPRCH